MTYSEEEELTPGPICQMHAMLLLIKNAQKNTAHMHMETQFSIPSSQANTHKQNANREE